MILGGLVLQTLYSCMQQSKAIVEKEEYRPEIHFTPEKKLGK